MTETQALNIAKDLVRQGHDTIVKLDHEISSRSDVLFWVVIDLNTGSYFDYYED